MGKCYNVVNMKYIKYIIIKFRFIKFKNNCDFYNHKLEYKNLGYLGKHPTVSAQVLINMF